MSLFNRKSLEQFEDSSQITDPTLATARIEIKRKRGANQREVKALLIRCNDSSTIYKATYETSKGDAFSYHTALETLENYAAVEGFEIISDSTNAEIGYIENSRKRSR